MSLFSSLFMRGISMTDLLSLDDATKKAKKLGVLQPGEIVNVKIEVACAYMKLHGMRPKQWRGDLLVVHKESPVPTAVDPAVEISKGN